MKSKEIIYHEVAKNHYIICGNLIIFQKYGPDIVWLRGNTEVTTETFNIILLFIKVMTNYVGTSYTLTVDIQDGYFENEFSKFNIPTAPQNVQHRKIYLDVAKLFDIVKSIKTRYIFTNRSDNQSHEIQTFERIINPSYSHYPIYYLYDGIKLVKYDILKTEFKSHLECKNKGPISTELQEMILYLTSINNATLKSDLITIK